MTSSSKDFFNKTETDQIMKETDEFDNIKIEKIYISKDIIK